MTCSLCESSAAHPMCLWLSGDHIELKETLNKGDQRLEKSIKSNLVNNDKFELNGFLNTSLNRYKFIDFINNENDFSGNDLTGVPSEIINAGLDFETTIGFFGNINFQYVGEQPITDSNSLYSESYSLTNFKIGFLKAD